MHPHWYELMGMSTVPAGLGHSDFINTFRVLRSTVVSDMPHRENVNKAWVFAAFPQTNAPFKCFPSCQFSFPDRKSLQSFSPHHRWLFNTSAATTNEPGMAAAWLDVDNCTQMFMSHSPAVLGWEVHFLARFFPFLLYFSQMFVRNQFRSVDSGCVITLQCLFHHTLLKKGI